MRLIIGNKAYSSWSLRGWLACKLSGLPFEERVIDMFGPDWEERRADPDLAPGGGRVPILWDGKVAVWDSLAIVEHLNDLTGNTRFWPTDPPARAHARAIAAEMHSGFFALRNECGMNLRHTYAPAPLSGETQAEVARIVDLWQTARTRFGGGGDYLFGDFGAADIMYAPVVTRFVTYAVPVPADVQSYIDAVIANPWMKEWTAAAFADPHVIAKYER